MSDYRSILFNSKYLENVIKFYGWTSETASLSLGSMVDSLTSLQDWRVDCIIANAQYFSLDLESNSVLEVGFGTGSLTTVARKRGVGIIGIDYTAEYICTARQLAERAGFSDSEIFQMFSSGDVEQLNFQNDSFSIIICSGVLEFINHPMKAMREMLRVLRPGGIIILSTSDDRYPFEAQYQIPWLPFMPRNTANVWLEGFNKPIKGLDYLKYVSLPQTLGLMYAAGFKILQAITTVPETQIAVDLEKIYSIGKFSGYTLNNLEQVYRLARTLSKNPIDIKGSGFIITAQKPIDPVCPGMWQILQP